MAPKFSDQAMISKTDPSQSQMKHSPQVSKFFQEI